MFHNKDNWGKNYEWQTPRVELKPTPAKLKGQHSMSEYQSYGSRVGCKKFHLLDSVP